jgi:predicted HAD superfamily Cof-like phosphohydrolase
MSEEANLREKLRKQERLLEVVLRADADVFTRREVEEFHRALERAADELEREMRGQEFGESIQRTLDDSLRLKRGLAGRLERIIGREGG